MGLPKGAISHDMFSAVFPGMTTFRQECMKDTDADETHTPMGWTGLERVTARKLV